MLKGSSKKAMSRWCVAVVSACLMLTTVGVESASALDKNQLVQMSKLGLDDKAIKGAIDSAGDELMFSEEELKDLEGQGVSKSVIEYLRQTGHVKAPAGGTTDPGVAPDPGVVPDPGVAPGPGGPAPGEEPETNQGLKAEEVAKLIELIKGLESEKKQAEQQLAASSTQVTKAIANVQDDRNNMEAARQCLAYQVSHRAYMQQIADFSSRLAELKVDPKALGVTVTMTVSPEVDRGLYEANYCLARALYNEEIYSGASRPLVGVLEAGAGPNRPYFKDAFYMLEDVTAKIGYRSPSLESVTATSLKNFNQEFNDDFNYYFGKFFFDYNRMEEARGFLKKVSRTAPDYPEARYLEGVSVLGTVQSQEDLYKVAKDALTAFQDAIVSAEQEQGGNEEILQLGYLALARTFYELGYYDVALYYYQKLPTESSRNAEAKLEQAWTYFLKNDHKKALGVFHMLGSPYYEKWFFPDLDLLEATIYLNLCRFEESNVALAELDSKYLSKQDVLRKFIEEMSAKEPAETWTTLVTYYQDGKGETGTGLPRMFADAVLDDIAFYNTYKQVQALRAERDALKANIGALGEFGQEVLARVEESLQIKVDEGGLLILQELSEIDQELGALKTQALQVSFDIKKEEKQELQRKLAGEEELTGTADGTTLLIVADDWHPWPFEGEYWLDEVANYRGNLRTECVEQ